MKRSFIGFGLALPLLLAAMVVWRDGPQPTPVRIGVLHSLSGIMASSETPLVDGLRLAVEEINAEGGLLGAPLEMLVADTRSDPAIAAVEAARLLQQEKVSALFGCWTSDCRKAVKPVVEGLNQLLFYPMHYEGLEQSPNILYTGLTPNQQIIPGTRWAMERFGKRVYLVGSDALFSRITNQIIRDLVTANDGEILGEQYISPTQIPAHWKMAAIVEDIHRHSPDVLLNTINGDGNDALFAGLLQAGLAELPLISFSVGENRMLQRGGTHLKHHYGVWNYFQGLASEENTRFVKAFKARFGQAAQASDPIESSYVGLRLWAQAVREEGSAKPHRINTSTLLRQSIAAPSGPAAIDTATRHLWKTTRLLKAGPDGHFELVTSTSVPLRPTPWPLYRSHEEWQALLETPPKDQKP